MVFENISLKWFCIAYKAKGIAAIPSLKLADTVILFQPRNASTKGHISPGTVKVAHIKDLQLRRQFEWEAPIKTFVCRSPDTQAQLAVLMLVARLLTVEFGVDPKRVHKEFQNVKEYAHALEGDF